MTSYVTIGHRLTGWNAVKNRVQQLGLELDDEQVKLITQELKTLADIKVSSTHPLAPLFRG
jgi:homocitrate synthase